MAPSFASSWRSFWHTMTSYDRHASYNSPYRTGQHVPLPQSRNAPLTSIATSAIESRSDLSYAHDSIEDSAFVNGANGRMSPQSPYKPGMRTSLQRVSTDNSASDIQMQNFSDGLPPAPPVSHSWKRIDRWAEDTYTELYDNLSDPCTQNDVNELEHELDCTLPLDVRESLQIHDGQERGGLPTGILFGCMLLDCEEIVQEWQNWRKVGDEYLTPTSSARNSAAAPINGAIALSSPTSATIPQLPLKAFAGISAAASSSSAPPIPIASPPQNQTNPQWRNDLLARQTCHPPNSIQHAYTNPSWIPLARDWGGNCIAVDLAPGPAGRWGQVIAFGRDYDCKFVLARSWAHFLASVADDFGAGDFRLEENEPLEGKGNGGKVFVDEETGDLRFREFWERQPGLDVPYLEVLRWRCEKKYGRRPQPRRGPPPVANGANGKPGLRINPNAGAAGPPARSFGGQHESPYASPTSVSSDQGFPERGRSPSRFSQAQGKQPLVSSPLARVAEEPSQKISIRTDLPTKILRGSNADKLVSVDTPIGSGDLGRITSFGSARGSTSLDLKENKSSGESERTPKMGGDGLLATPIASKPAFQIGDGDEEEASKKDSPQSKLKGQEGDMKTVAI